MITKVAGDAGKTETIKTIYARRAVRKYNAIRDPIFYGAPVVIFLTVPGNNEWASLDIGLCAQNIMLAAKSLGLDTCPVGLGTYVEKTSIFSRLQIPASEKIKLTIILGYGNESPEVHKRIEDNLLFID